MSYEVKILATEMLNHNVKRFRVEKPAGFEFEPGQATELALPKAGDLADEKRPFTFTSLPADPDLELTIKIYPDHEGVTDRLQSYDVGDVFEIGDAWGAITHQGPGIFLAGGAGVTPFIAILRSLHDSDELDGCELWFSNQTPRDAFLEAEFREMLGDRLRLLYTAEADAKGEIQRIDRNLLKSEIVNFEQNFYICGPDKMVEELSEALESLGVDGRRIVTEDFG